MGVPTASPSLERRKNQLSTAPKGIKNETKRALLALFSLSRGKGRVQNALLLSKNEIPSSALDNRIIHLNLSAPGWKSKADLRTLPFTTKAYSESISHLKHAQPSMRLRFPHANAMATERGSATEKARSLSTSSAGGLGWYDHMFAGAMAGARARGCAPAVES